VKNSFGKLGDDPCLPLKPSDPSKPSLTHLPYHQEDLAFIFSQKGQKGKKFIVFIHMHSSKMFDYLILHA